MKMISHFLSAKAMTLMAVLLTYPVAAAAQTAPDAESINPVMVGQQIPELSLRSADGKPFDLNAAIKEKPSVLIFYRGGWCPYCNTHLADLRKIEGELKQLGFQIFAISPDNPEHLRESMDKMGMKYQLLSDSDMSAAQSLGLAFQVDDETVKQYREHGLDLTEYSGEGHNQLPVPAALLVDTTGRVTFAFVAPNYKTRVDNRVLMAAARAQIDRTE